jgi:hypothetical protein
MRRRWTGRAACARLPAGSAAQMLLGQQYRLLPAIENYRRMNVLKAP